MILSFQAEYDKERVDGDFDMVLTSLVACLQTSENCEHYNQRVAATIENHREAFLCSEVE